MHIIRVDTCRTLPGTASGQQVALVPAPPSGAGAWEAASLDEQSSPVLQTRRLSSRACAGGRTPHEGSSWLSWETAAAARPPVRHVSLHPQCHQKRQEPRRLWAWRRSADRERLMCLVVARTLSAAWTARLRALLSSSRSSRSSWMERLCPPAAREEAAGGHSAAGRAEGVVGAEVGPPGGA